MKFKNISLDIFPINLIAHTNKLALAFIYIPAPSEPIVPKQANTKKVVTIA